MPVASAAVYVPAAARPYPSTVVMGVVTARAAGVIDVAVCAPPGADGEIDPAILGTCRLCGVERVYRMGGAQAIAALAYGTETVARVDVIVGPGQPLRAGGQAAALRESSGIDGFAGPERPARRARAAQAATEELELAALDMLAQAEHGEGSLVVAVSPVGRASATRSPRCSSAASSSGRPSAMPRSRSCEVADARAGARARQRVRPRAPAADRRGRRGARAGVRAAGCLFVGAESATAFGDYVAGSNHVLPTAGAARFASSSRRATSGAGWPRCASAPAAAKLAAAGAPIARAEGFEVHAESMEARIGENRPA